MGKVMLIILLATLSPRLPCYAEARGTESFAAEATEKGWRFFRIGDQATALKRFRQAIILDPDYAPGYYGVAYIYSIEERLSLAIRYYRKSIELADAPDTHAYCNLGLALMRLGKKQAALEMLEKALKTDPGNGKAHIGLAYYYCSKKNGKLVRYNVEKAEALGLQPDPGLTEKMKRDCP